MVSAKPTLWPVLLLSAWPAYGEVSWELPPLPSPSSSLSIDYAADSAAGWSRQLAASLAGPMQLRFDLAYGESYVSADTAELKTGFRAFGIATDPLAVIGTDLSYERWGRDDELTIDTLRLGLRLDLGDFAFSLMPQQRSIRLFARERFRNILPYVDVDSQDLGFSLGYYGLADWALSAEYFHYGYSEDLSRLADNFLALFVFPLETLELASGLNARHLTLGATRFLSAGEIGFEWLRAASAVDGSIATVGTLHGSVDLSPAWQLNLQGGVQSVDYSADSILFLGMGIGYRW